MFDHLRCGWRSHCEGCGPTVFWLPALRSVEQLEGSTTGWGVEYDCPECGERAWTLRSSEELDFDPYTDPWPTHHELLTGRTWWFGGARSIAARNLARGEWPFAWRCGDRARFGGPTSVVELRPGGDEYRAEFRCDCGGSHPARLRRGPLERPPAVRMGW